MIVEQVKKLIPYKKSKQWMADKLGVSVEEINEALLQLNIKPKSVNFLQRGDFKIPETSITYTGTSTSQWINLEEGTLKSEVECDFSPKDDLELAELHKINLEKYKISSYWTKQRGDKFTSSLLCSLKKPQDYTPEQFAEFLKGYIPPRIDYKINIKPLSLDKSTFVDISIMDFHIDKGTLEKETVYERQEEYLKAVKYLMEMSEIYNPHTYVFTIGNDFFQTDTYSNTTTSGTPVDVSTSFNQSYEVGFDTLVQAIRLLRSRGALVHVINVSGNHARTKEFYLAHALSIFFREDQYVHFDIKEGNLKYALLGETFIGYHHGDCRKLDELPLIFATDPRCSHLFGSAKYREVKTGDKHFYLTKEVKGVRIQQIPSMSSADRWHRDHLFIHNIRAGLATIYHPTKGKIAEIEHRVG